MKSIDFIIKQKVTYRRGYDGIWEIDSMWHELDVFNFKVFE